MRVWDTRQPEVPTAAFLPEAGSGSGGTAGSGDAGARDCWCVAIGNAFNAEERCVLAGYANGDIKMTCAPAACAGRRTSARASAGCRWVGGVGEAKHPTASRRLQLAPGTRGP